MRIKEDLACDAGGAVLRGGLPYGVVMATAGASVMAGQLAMADVEAALWWLAVLEAVFIALRGGWHARSTPRSGWHAWWVPGSARGCTGAHTVPLGLAVIVSGATGFATAPRALLWVALAGVWLITVLCVLRFVVALAVHGAALSDVDGTWFLVPAALLGAAVAAAELVPVLPASAASGLVLLAWLGAVLGWVGYWLVAAAAAVRVARIRLADVPHASWWIAMGCAGLAAGALGAAARAGMGGPPWLNMSVRYAVGATQAVAIALLVPVLLFSLRFLCWRCRWCGRAAWPPTFSTAVFALGALHTGALLGLPWMTKVGQVAAAATVVLWLISGLWNIVMAPGRLRFR